MGACCTKQSSSFSSPGRPLGATPSGPSSIGVPASATRPPPPRVGGPPRTLGGGATSTTPGADAEEARKKAAAAAEARAQQQSAKTGSGGDLTKKLAEQRRLTQRATLEVASRQNVREREVDASADALRNA
ncbi:hypothetical protein B0T18DRAFT_424588 [Schizothecium vesticola]|uniref:Uncharacterized protein n=1 Tax=Schizothecium vesticola TaxID=314040 RepID=A0AA40FAQ3_9PEZI|nr:hypothetical protein B0T18DRAFT_424588 [Schizothecium vesticola]